MNEPEDTRDMSELIEAWRNQVHAHSMEGSRGINQFEELCKLIGYRDGNYFNDALRNFLYDNSGAIEALITWIEEQKSDEWTDALRDEVPLEEEEEE